MNSVDLPAVRSGPRMLYVKRTQRLTPSLQRITLAGPQLAGFPLDSAGSHIKLFLARAGQREPVLPTLGPDGPIYPPPEIRPISRTYTVAHFDAIAGELEVDFVVHAHQAGPAAQWAKHAQIGDAIGLAGPGGPPRALSKAQAYLLLGDPSAFAMIRATLEALPSNAQGVCLLEVANDEEILPLGHPPGIAMHWRVRGTSQPAAQSSLLLDAVRAWRWPAGLVSATLAGESTQMVRVRDFLLAERNVSKTNMYAVPYWKEQLTEEAYHLERHRIMDEVAA